MTDHKGLICVKCGSPVVVRDGDALVMDEGRRFTVYCSTMGRLHGFVEGSTEEAALAAYAKDQEWGMEQLGKLAAYEEFEQGLKGAAKKIWESI